MTTRAALVRCAGVPTAALCDANDKQGAFPPGIGRITGAGRIAGRARTAQCAEGSVAAVFAAIESAAPGDILVVQGAGEWAYFGDLAAAAAAPRGVVGAIVDGLARDAAELTAIGFPLFARGLTPRGARRAQAGAVGVELRLGATVVRPGDIVVADVDGVVAISIADADAVVARAEEIVAAEAERWRRTLAGS